MSSQDGEDHRSCLIEFNNIAEAVHVIREFEGTELDGRVLRFSLRLRTAGHTYFVKAGIPKKITQSTSDENNIVTHY